jgi:hypothetical protein
MIVVGNAWCLCMRDVVVSIVFNCCVILIDGVDYLTVRYS